MKYSSSNFNCASIQSSISGTNDGDLASATCNSKYSTMVSCGWRSNPQYPSIYQYEGAYVDTINGVDTCIAQNGNGGQGVYARARCCDFRHLGDVDCITTKFGTISVDNATVQGECTGTYKYLTGCMMHSDADNFDGAYFGLLEPSVFLPLCSFLIVYIQKCVLLLLYSQWCDCQYRL